VNTPDDECVRRRFPPDLARHWYPDVRFAQALIAIGIACTGSLLAMAATAFEGDQRLATTAKLSSSTR
jgi:hypothetical protein